MDRYDFIVIGAGIAGLEIGALLSELGKVIVIEKSNKIGGRAMVVEKEGFKLDFGGHPVRFGPKSAIATTMGDVGEPVDFIKPGMIRALLKDGTKDIFPSGGIKAILKTHMVPKFKMLKMVLKFMFMNEEKIRDLMDVSISEYVNEQGIEDDRIKRYLKMACAAIMVCPFLDRVSTGEFIENVKEVLDKGSVYYPRGGWNSFFDPLITTIQKNGGIVQKQTLVERIEVKDGQAVGVKIKGKDEIIEAKHVINTVPVQKIFDHLLDPSLTDEEFVENCEGLRYTTGIAIDFALSRPVTDIDGIMMLEKPAGFGFVPSNLSPELVPNGKSLMTFFIPLNKEDMDTEEKRKLHYRELRDMVLLHFPEIDDVLEFERPLYFDMVDGVECAVDQHKYIRPGNTVPGIENLWLTGDSAGGHGSGGDIGHTSVRECFKKIKKTWTSGN